MAYIHVFMTGERITPESAESGDCTESGFIDPNWSMTEIQDRNNAGTVLSITENDPDLETEVRIALESYLGVWSDNGDGTFYGSDVRQDPGTGDYWAYALHFVRKYFDWQAGKYVERPWDPATVGIDCEAH